MDGEERYSGGEEVGEVGCKHSGWRWGRRTAPWRASQQRRGQERRRRSSSRAGGQGGPGATDGGVAGVWSLSRHGGRGGGGGGGDGAAAGAPVCQATRMAGSLAASWCRGGRSLRALLQRARCGGRGGGEEGAARRWQPGRVSPRVHGNSPPPLHSRPDQAPALCCTVYPKRVGDSVGRSGGDPRRRVLPHPA